MVYDFSGCDASDSNLAGFLGGLISCLDSGNPEVALRRTALGSIAEVTTLRYVPTHDAIPDVAFIDADSCNYLIMSGVRNFNDHMRPLALSYLDGPQDFGVGGVNLHLQMAATVIIGFLKLTVNNSRAPTFIGGHSYGGAIAKLIVKRLRRDPAFGRVYGVSFGAPKVGDAEFESGWQVNTFRRYMNDADPVPLVFPSSVQAPQFHTILPVVESAHVDSFVQGGQGVEFFSNGTCRDAVLPSRSVQFPQTTIIQWLYGLTEPNANDHSISTYNDRIHAYILAHPSAPSEPNLPPAPVPVQEVTPQQRDAVLSEARNQALAMMRENAGNAPRGESAPRISLEKEGPFRIGKSDVGALITTDNSQKVKRFRRHMYSLWKMTRGASVIDWDLVKDYMGG